MHPNPVAAAIPRSGTREIGDLARTDPAAIRLEIGDPDFPTPPHISQAAARAARDGANGYTPNTGLPELREAIAAKVSARNGCHAAPRQTVVTQGATQGVFASLSALTEPGDTVLLPDPAWPNYLMMASLLRTAPAYYRLGPETNYQPDLAQLESLVTPRTRVLVLNSPSNPLGTLIDTARLEALIAFAERHDLWILSDECYDEMVFEGTCHSPAAIASHRTVAAYSFSKTYAMSGWRIGYTVAPPQLAPILATCQETMLACVSAPIQHAALAALTEPADSLSAMRTTYCRRRDLVAGLAAAADIAMPLPAGAFYAWISIGRSGVDSTVFARQLLRQQHVAVAPGSAFGTAGRRFVRLSLAADNQLLTEGVNRLSRQLDVAGSCAVRTE